MCTVCACVLCACAPCVRVHCVHVHCMCALCVHVYHVCVCTCVHCVHVYCVYMCTVCVHRACVYTVCMCTVCVYRVHVHRVCTVCVHCVYVCTVCACAPCVREHLCCLSGKYMWRSEDSLQKSVCSFHHVGLGNYTQVLRLGSKRLSPLDHLCSSYQYAACCQAWESLPLLNWVLLTSIVLRIFTSSLCHFCDLFCHEG